MIPSGGLSLYGTGISPTKSFFSPWYHWKIAYLHRTTSIKRGMCGPNIYILCSCREESIYHVFVSCHFAKSLWIYVYRIHNLLDMWVGKYLAECFKKWKMCGQAWVALPSFLSWEI